MKFAVKWTLWVLALVAIAGVLLRAMPLMPDTGIPFASLRHAHSHLAFLGWVFGAFNLALVHFFLGPGRMETPRYRKLFWATQGVAVVLFAAFVAQGYGFFSIALLTLHTILAFVFFYRFYRDSARATSPTAYLFGMTAIAAFVISSMGPFAIPLVQRLAPGDPSNVRMAVHFYLHFHYDGWFVFGIMAVLYRILEQAGIHFSRRLALWQWRLMVLALAPAYFLHAPLALLADPLPLLIALLHFGGIAVFLFHFAGFRRQLMSTDSKAGQFLLYLAVTSIALKYTLDLLSAWPPLVAVFGRGNHFLVLGYLHLLFLGAVTPFIWWVMLRAKWIASAGAGLRWGIPAFATGFILSEVVLFSLGLNLPVQYTSEMLLGTTVLLALGVWLLVAHGFGRPSGAGFPRI